MTSGSLGEHFRISIDGMMDAFAMLTAVRDDLGQIIDFRCDYVNDAASIEFNRAKEEMLSKRCTELASDFTESLLFQRYREVVDIGKSQLVSAVRWEVSVNGRREQRYYDIQVVKLKDGVTSIWRNVTERVRAETLLEEQQRLMLHSFKMNALGQMAAEMSHEILTPLTYIVCKVYLMRRMIQAKTIDFAEMNDAIKEVESTSMRIRKIIDGLRSYSHIDPQETVKREALTQILDDTLVLCKQRFDRAQVRVDVVHPPSADNLQIECFSAQISEVLLNLLNNAFDAIENQPKKWLRIQANDQGDWAEIRITDSGKGIPMELRKKIFGAFYTTKPVGKGTGLGLSLSRDIIERHNGSLTLEESSPHTEFVIRLPKRQPGESALAPREQSATD